MPIVLYVELKPCVFSLSTLTCIDSAHVWAVAYAGITSDIMKNLVCIFSALDPGSCTISVYVEFKISSQCWGDFDL